jgi:hypothetical protein
MSPGLRKSLEASFYLYTLISINALASLKAVYTDNDSPGAILFTCHRHQVDQKRVVLSIEKHATTATLLKSKKNT